MWDNEGLGLGEDLGEVVTEAPSIPTHSVHTQPPTKAALPLKGCVGVWGKDDKNIHSNHFLSAYNVPGTAKSIS